MDKTDKIEELRRYLLELEEEEKKEKSPQEENLDRAGALIEGLKDSEASERREEINEIADDQISRGNERSDTAAGKSDELYTALRDFIGKQDGRYDDLIAAIIGDGEGKNAASIRESYAEAGDRAVGHTLAENAAENGGNPDTYAAAQGDRRKLAYLNEGEAAVRADYEAQLDRLLEAIQASSGDLGDLFGLVQDNVSGDNEAAKNHLSIGESLFSSLMDADNDAAKNASDTLAKLFDKLTDGRYLGDISPMQVDREFIEMTKGGGGQAPAYSERDALIALWEKYPTMHAYILEKYEDLIKPDYRFE